MDRVVTEKTVLDAVIYQTYLLTYLSPARNKMLTGKLYINKPHFVQMFQKELHMWAGTVTRSTT